MVGVEKLEARNQIDRKTIFKVITVHKNFSELAFLTLTLAG